MSPSLNTFCYSCGEDGRPIRAGKDNVLLEIASDECEVPVRQVQTSADKCVVRYEGAPGRHIRKVQRRCRGGSETQRDLPPDRVLFSRNSCPRNGCCAIGRCVVREQLVDSDEVVSEQLGTFNCMAKMMTLQKSVAHRARPRDYS
jgi:hypothetical protein